MAASTLITPLTRRLLRSPPKLLAPPASTALGPFRRSQLVYFSSTWYQEIITDAEAPPPDLDEEEELKKRLDVAIVGYPNAGKSQLLNALLGTKVAAVSRKRHTTRGSILGVTTQDDAQLVFCDTPGFMTSTDDKVGDDLHTSAKGYMETVDYSLVVIDAAKTKIDDDYYNTLLTLMWNALHSAGGGRFGIVLNKCDLVKPKTKLLEAAIKSGGMGDKLLMEKIKLQPPDQQPLVPEDLMPQIFYTSAKYGHKDEGVKDVREHLLKMAIPEREWMIPDADADDVTPMDYGARVEEILREKIYRTLHREVPHQLTQRNRQFEVVRGHDDEPSIVMIHQDLVVRSKSHLKLLTRWTSANMQRIHDSAVPELRKLFGCEVLLTLNAKLVNKNRR